MMIVRDTRLAAHPGITHAATVAGSVAVVAAGLRTPIILVITGLLLWLVGLTRGLAFSPSDRPPEPGRDRGPVSTVGATTTWQPGDDG